MMSVDEVDREVVGSNVHDFPGNINVACKVDSMEVIDQGNNTKNFGAEVEQKNMIEEDPSLTPKDLSASNRNLATYAQPTENQSSSLPDNECRSCTNCTEVCSVHVDMNQQDRIRSTGRPHFCLECNKNFKLVSQLKIHERIHKNERPYMCEYCQKGFKQPSNLTQHRRIHTGERPYQCSFCEKTFKQKSQVMQHERLHTGSKPYVCKQCQRGFVQLSQLQSHEKTHRDRAEKFARKNRIQATKNELRVELMPEDISDSVLLS